MKIQNHQIKTILLNIAGVELDPVQSSARRRIIRVLRDYDEDVEAIRMELIGKLADKKGEAYEHDANGNFKFTKANSIKFRNEFKKVLDEKIDIKIDATNKKDWETLKDILGDIKKKHTKEKMRADTFDLVETLGEIIEIIK